MRTPTALCPKHAPSPTTRHRWWNGFLLLLVGAGLGAPARAVEIPFTTQPAITSTALGAHGVFAADIDGDGDLDTLSASEDDDTIAWHENTAGDGSAWTSHTISTTADSARSVFAADLDGDGDTDALSASRADDTVAWYENTAGDGSAWTAHTITALADGAFAVFAADLDGDGDTDVLSADSNRDQVTWYENTAGDASAWTAQPISTAAGNARAVHAADIDGDGDLDALSASRDDDLIGWHANTAGDGSAWTAHTISAVADGASSVFAADLDGDGDLDALGAASIDDSVTWYENTAGDGSAWTAHPLTTSATGAISVLAADADGDGDLDAFWAARGADEVGWFENTAGDGSAWTARTITTLADAVRAAFVADLDGDGDLDALAAAANDNEIQWFRNDTIHRSARFPEEMDVVSNIPGIRTMDTGDFDGDGDIDALAARSFDRVQWLENTSGDGSAWTTHDIATADLANTRAVMAADVDGDGDLDALSAASTDDSVAWHENTAGDGSAWTSHTISDTVDGPFSVFAADVDDDGDLDVLSAASVDDEVAWHENTAGDGSTWTAHSIDAATNGASDVFGADIDGDEDVDAVSAIRVDNRIAWHENTAGDGSAWTTHDIATAVFSPESVVAADVDGDGDLDVLSATRTDDEVAWHENTAGDGSAWTAHTITDTFDGTSLVIAADIDHDGDLDVVATATTGDEVAWFENLAGDGSAWSEHVVSTTTDIARAAAVADVDGDGDADLFAASQGDGQVYWYPNQGGQFALPTAGAAPARVLQSGQDAVLAIDLAHRGRTGDSDVELTGLELFWTDGTATPLTTEQANALVQSLDLYRDDGDGSFDAGLDTLVESFGPLTLTGGSVTLPFADDDPDLAGSVGADPTFFLAASWTSDAAAALPDDLAITHVTSASSTADDATHDIPLVLETSPDETTGPIEINDPPVAGNDGPFMIDEDSGPIPAPGSLLDDDNDEEDQGALTAVVETPPSHAAAFAIEPDGVFLYEPAAHFSGQDTFTYRADDGFETSDPATVTIDVTPVADAPNLTVADASGTTDQPIVLTIDASLVDDDGSETLEIEISGVPAGATLSAGADQGGGVWLLQPADLDGLTFTSAPGDDNDVTLTVDARATETGNADQATTTDTLVVTVEDPLFADGFESGDTTAWSGTVP